MKRQLKLWMSVVLVLLLWVTNDIYNASAQIKDGTYTIQYTVMHGSDPSASIANDYWEKPATLYVKDGNITAEMAVNHSAWITEFKVGGTDVDIVSEDTPNDTRVNRFQIQGIQEMTKAEIHVIVPDIDYDHGYTVRFDFDESSLQEIVNTSVNTNDDETETDEDNNEIAPSGETDNGNESNPQTSDSSPVFWLTILAGTALVSLIGKRFINL